MLMSRGSVPEIKFIENIRRADRRNSSRGLCRSENNLSTNNYLISKLKMRFMVFSLNSYNFV